MTKDAARWLEAWRHDLRSAFRALLCDRAFTLTTLFILAPAIGLNLAVFEVVNTALFRGYPLVHDNGSLVYIQERETLKDGCCILYVDYLAWRERVPSFRDMAFIGSKAATLSDGGLGTRDVNPTLVTWNTFGMLGVRPALGRDFTPEDAVPGAPQVLILPHQVWIERYGGRSDIIGHPVRIDKAPATIIGVMPEGFAFPESNALWMPLQSTADMLERKPNGGAAVGRLAPGATIESARAELDVVERGLETAFPASNKGVRAVARAFPEYSFGPDVKAIYGSVWAAGALVLLIACANIANLGLARTLGRSLEFSIRIALGVGRWRMARQLMAENVLLALVGGSLGWWLGQTALRVWIQTTATRYLVLDYSGGWEIVAYALGITVAASALFGLLPTLRALHTEVGAGLKGDSRSVTMTRSAKRTSQALVASQAALAIVLLIGAGVLTRSLWRIVGSEIGVQGADRVLVGVVQVSREDYPTPESRVAYWDELRASVQTIPGVEFMTRGTRPLMNPGTQPFELEDWPTDAEHRPRAARIGVGPGYFRALGAPMIAGREFTDADGLDSPAVAIVNRSFVDRFWKGQDALGKRLAVAAGPGPPQWFTVVGVVSNIMQNRPLRDEFVPIAYVPIRRQLAAAGTILVRTRVPAEQLAPQVRKAIEGSAPGVSIENYARLQDTLGFNRDFMDLEHAELGKHAMVAPIFALIALLLAAVGLYASIAHSVRRRTREIGIRLAVGATPSNIAALILREAITPAITGLAVGLLASMAVNRVLQSQLVGVSPRDPITVAVATLVLVLSALAGCYAPCRRAMRVDPNVALRQDG